MEEGGRRGSTAKSLRIPRGSDGGWGFNVSDKCMRPSVGTVSAGSTAATKGLAPGDLLAKINGTSVKGKTFAEVQQLLEEVEGDTVEVATIPSDQTSPAKVGSLKSFFSSKINAAGSAISDFRARKTTSPRVKKKLDSTPEDCGAASASSAPPVADVATEAPPDTSSDEPQTDAAASECLSNTETKAATTSITAAPATEGPAEEADEKEAAAGEVVAAEEEEEDAVTEPTPTRQNDRRPSVFLDPAPPLEATGTDPLTDPRQSVLLTPPGETAEEDAAEGPAEEAEAPDGDDIQEVLVAPQSAPASPTPIVPATDVAEAPSGGAAKTDPSPPSCVADIGKHSQHGTRHGELNQDSCWSGVAGSPTSPLYVAAAFDGHGLLGERAAAAGVRTLQKLCEDPNALAGFVQGPDGAEPQPEAAMTELFSRLNEGVLAEHKTPPDEYAYPGKPGTDPLNFKLVEVGGSLGKAYEYVEGGMPPAPIDFGCTAAVAVVDQNGQAVVGSLGDAGAVLCVHNEYGEPDGRLVSAAHTASDPSEQERIDRDFPDKVHFTHDGYLAPLDDEVGQCEVQLTRSLGHAVLRDFGLIDEPKVVTLDLEKERAFGLVLCSDGITDELKPRDVADRVAAAGPAQEGAAVLCQDAQDFCMDRNKVDDCTAAVILFGTE